MRENSERGKDGNVEELISLKEAAERLNVTLDAVYKMVERGDLTEVRVMTPRSLKKGVKRVRAAEVAAYKPNANKETRPKRRRVHSYHMAGES